MIETPAFIISIHSTRLNRADVTPLESQDSQKSPFFIYSIYGYKNSSLPDVSSWDIWSQMASMRRLERERGRRRACGVPELCFVLPGGGHWRSASRFSRRQTPAPERIWMKECRPVAGEAFARALPARRPCELLTRAASSCTALSRGWGGVRGGLRRREKSGAYYCTRSICSAPRCPSVIQRDGSDNEGR